MKMFRSLALTLALMALPFAESFAADGLTALPDGGYVVEFNRLRIPIGGKSTVWGDVYLSFPGDKNIQIGERSKYEHLKNWDVSRVMKEPELFREVLGKAIYLSARGARKIEHSTTPFELRSGYKPSGGEDSINYSVSTDKDTPLFGDKERHIIGQGQIILNAQYVRDGFFGPNAPSIKWVKSSYRRNFYGIDVVMIENNYNFDDYDIQKHEYLSSNSAMSNKRYFSSISTLFIECRNPSSSCKRLSYDRDESIYIEFSFNKNIHRSHWLALDAYIHSILPELFVGPVPEGIE